MKHPADTDYYVVDRNQLFPLEKVKSMVDLEKGFVSTVTSLSETISQKS